MDGKDIRGASKQTGEGRRMMVAAAGHGTGMALRQVEVDAKSNEIPAVRELSGSLDVTGRIVTVDAMHARHYIERTARTTYATSPATRTGAGCTSAICRATFPA